MEPASSWSRHPGWSAVVRFAAFALPIGAGVLAGFALAAALWRPDGWASRVAWWVVLVGGVLAAVALVERVARRLLPLAVLLRMTLAFPDRAPARFVVALQGGSTRLLRRRVERARAAGVTDDPSRSAEFILTLATALSSHDRITRGHAERTRAYAELLGRELGFGEEDLDRLRWAALLHDVGKLTVAGEILNKEHALDAGEWDTVRQHPVDGHELTRPLHGFLGRWATTILHHHERWDGTGYPAGLSGEEINPGARLVAVADAYDAMTALRSYQKPVSAARARAELANEAGRQFDPRMVRAFLDISLGRLRRVAGVAALLAQIPFLGSVPRLGPAGSTAVAGAAAVAVVAAGGVVPAPPAAVVEFTAAPEAAGFEPGSLEILAAPEGMVAEVLAGGVIRIHPGPEAPASFVVTYRACTPDGLCLLENVAVTPQGSVAALPGERSLLIPPLAAGAAVRVPEPPAGGILDVGGDGTVTYTPDPGFAGPDRFVVEVCAGSCRLVEVTVTVAAGAAPVMTLGPAPPPPATSTTTTTTTSTTTTAPPPTSTTTSTTTTTTTTTTSTTAAPTTTTTTTTTAPPTTTTSTTTTTAPPTTTTSTTAPPATTTTTTPPDVTAVPDVAETDEEVPVDVAVLLNDSGPVDPATVAVVTPPAGAATSVQGDGSITVTPDQDVNGEVWFEYEVCDTARSSCSRAGVTVTVRGVNDPPRAEDDSVETPVDTPIEVFVLDNDSDPDPGDVLAVTAGTYASDKGGTVTCTTVSCTYAPPPGFKGNDDFDYEISDLDGDAATARVSVKIKD